VLVVLEGRGNSLSAVPAVKGAALRRRARRLLARHRSGLCRDGAERAAPRHGAGCRGDFLL